MTRNSIIPAWLLAWWPAILWAGLIFFLSTDTFSAGHTGSVLGQVLRWLAIPLSRAHLELLHHLVRKSAHFTEYFIFYLLLYRGIRGERPGRRWSWAFLAWLIAAAYSTLDEIHQSFVASRTASAWDSFLDSVAAFFALLILFLIYGPSRRPRPASPNLTEPATP